MNALADWSHNEVFKGTLNIRVWVHKSGEYVAWSVSDGSRRAYDPRSMGRADTPSEGIAAARRYAIKRYRELSGGDGFGALAITRPTLTTIVLALGVGAITAAVWAAFAKRNIERTFTAGGAELRAELERGGSTLRAELAQVAADSAVRALRDEAADLGITPGMLRDLQTAVEAAEAVRVGARRAGATVESYIRSLA